MGEKKNLILCTGPIPESKGICVIFQKRAKNVKKDKILFYYIFIFIQDKLIEYIQFSESNTKKPQNSISNFFHF